MTSNSQSPPQGRDRKPDEYRNGSSGQSSSGAPTTATTESGGSSSKSRTNNRFLPFPASKACDICKLRKVKCVGGRPCEACRLHTTECVFSGFTRKQLLQEHNRPRGGSSSGNDRLGEGNDRLGEGTSGDVGSVKPLQQNQSPSAPSAPIDPVPPEWITPTLASMPVPYGMTPVDWSGISWPTHRSPVPRDSISSDSKGGGEMSNEDSDGYHEGLHNDLTIRRMREDAFGNAGMVLYEGDSRSRNMEFWGITSYIGLQDLLTRMLQVRIQQSHETIGQKAFTHRRGIEPESRGTDLWRWGCERYIFRDRLRDPDMPNPDPMFLPSRLAYRFLHEFAHVIHPLFPVLDIAAVERSIAASFDASRPGVRRPFPDLTSPRIERARDMLVLAFGAQVITGDGDGDCPKDIAVVWSETLRRAAYGIMNDMDAFEGGVDLIRLWIIYAEFSRSDGNSGAEFEAMNTAARSITRMGLHKRGTYEFDVAEANDYRTVFAVSFYSEKWACLCHGNPSTLAWGADAIEIAAGMKENSRLSVMMRLARLADDVQSVFDELTVLSVEAGIRRLLDLYEQVLAFHAEVGGHFDAVEHLRIELPREFNRDDYQRTLVLFTIYGMYLQVKTLCLLPMLQLCVWRALGRDGLGDVGLEADQYVEGLADECVKTACETLAMFERHIAMYPHTPELSLSSIFMLYAVSIVYMDVLRLPVVIASARHSGHVKSALKSLEHYDHPAATLAEAMCRDLLVNFIDEPALPDDNQEVQGMEMRI